MNLEQIITYGGGLIALAIIVRNGKEVNMIIMAISEGARSVSSVLITGRGAM